MTTCTKQECNLAKNYKEYLKDGECVYARKDGGCKLEDPIGYTSPGTVDYTRS